MTWTTCLIPLTTVLTVCGAVSSAEDLDYVFKRSHMLEGRVNCPSGYVPACPVGIPCVPPGSVCCDDGITYVMLPKSCPDGTTPIATASNQVSAASITLAPTPSPPVEYTTEYTWYYHVTYFTLVDFSTRLTSSEITTVSTISVSAIDPNDAATSFGALIATLVLPTPTQTTTEVRGYPTITASYVVPTANSTLATGTGTGAPVPSYSHVPISAAVSLRARNGCLITMICAFAVAPAGFLIWL